MLNNTKKYTLFSRSYTCNPRTQPCDMTASRRVGLGKLILALCRRQQRVTR
jgi:hypothetical protein